MLRTLLITLSLTMAALAQAQPAPDAGAPTAVLTRAPAIVTFVEAAYPAEAEQAGLQGVVKLQVDLGEDGKVTAVSVLEPAGHGFDEAALAAVKQFLFSPAEIDGKPAAVRITYNYRFLLKAPPPRPEVAQAPQQGPVNFSGQLRERGSRKVLAGVELALPDLGLRTITDAQGRFELREVPVGEVQVVVVAAGFEKFSTRERIDVGKETRATYYVQPQFFSAFESVVRGRKERKEVSQTTLQVEEVQRIPGTQGDSIKVVQNLPGVARPSAIVGGGAIIIRGTEPKDSGIYLDGFRIPILYHFGGLSSVFNSDLLGTIDYLPGSYSTYYGDQIGGVVDLKSRAPRGDAIHGYANLSLIDTSLELEGPIAKGLTFAIAGRRSYIDAVLKLASGALPNLTVAPRYYDAQAQLQYKPNPRHTFTLLALTDDDIFELLIQKPVGDDSLSGKFHLEDGFTQLRLRHEYRSGGVHTDTAIYGGPTFIDVEIGSARALKIYAHEYGIRQTTELELDEHVTAALGLDVNYSRTTLEAQVARPPREGENPAPGAVSQVIHSKNDNFYYLPSTWIELRLRPISRLLLVPGLRAETYIYSLQDHPDRSLSPRLGVRYGLSDQVTVKGGAGVYHGPPVMEEPSRDFGNPNIRSKRANQYSLGVEYTPTPEIFGSLEGYYGDLRDLFVSLPGPPLLTNGAIGRTYGLELLVRHALTRRFFGWVAYTLSRSERRDHPGDAWRLFDNDQTHILTVIGSYKLPHGFQLGARFRLVSGNPSTPVVGAVRYDNADAYVPIFGPTNSERLPAFHQLDVRLDKTWVFDLWSLDLYLDVQNAYNHASIEGVSYSYDFRQRDFFKGLPVLPIIGLKGSF
jgi:TonB family protein